MTHSSNSNANIVKDRLLPRWQCINIKPLLIFVDIRLCTSSHYTLHCQNSVTSAILTSKLDDSVQCVFFKTSKASIVELLKVDLDLTSIQNSWSQWDFAFPFIFPKTGWSLTLHNPPYSFHQFEILMNHLKMDF